MKCKGPSLYIKGHNQWSEGQPGGMGRTLANHISDKGFMPRIRKYCKSKRQATQLKMNKELELLFLQRRHINGQQKLEEILNISNYYGNANQNYNKIPPHTY